MTGWRSTPEGFVPLFPPEAFPEDRCIFCGQPESEHTGKDKQCPPNVPGNYGTFLSAKEHHDTPK